MIQVYDVTTDEFREATQEDVDLLQSAAGRLAQSCGELRSKLARARGALCLALPAMHADESPKGKTDYSVVREVYNELAATQE